jgi:hypothetical protein
MHDMIDFDHFLPVKGEHEWCKENFPLNSVDDHPTTNQHKEFTEKIIWPWLVNDKKFI